MADVKIAPANTSPLPTTAPGGLTAKFMMAVIAAIVVTGLYMGRPVLMPLALAVLMSFALAPLVGLLRLIRIGQLPAVLLSLVTALVLVTGLGIFVGSQITGLAADLPSYQNNLGAKIKLVQSATGRGVFARLNQTIEQLADQITGEREQRVQVTAQQAEKPIPVVIRRSMVTPVEMAQTFLGPLLEPLGLIALVLVLVGFIMLQRDDLRNRFVRLAGPRDMQRTAVALDEAATRLSRYLALQTTINACFGLVIGAGLYLIDIPNAGLWAMLAMLMRFVPYVGVPIAFVFPAMLALAVDPGWAQLAWVAALFASIEAVVSQMIEPFVYGRSMGLSAVAVVAAAVFWTWLWGPVGLLLSTPLTMCFVVLGRHIKALKFLDVMLGNSPPLAIEERLYLRMLAEDADDATDDPEDFLKSNTLSVYYDEVAARALMLAQYDVNRGVLDQLHQERIRDAIKGLIANLGERKDKSITNALTDFPAAWGNQPVLCVAGRGPLDEAAAMLLLDMLARHGVSARTVSSDQTSAAQIEGLDVEGVKIVCVSYLEPGTYKNARYQVRRLRKRLPDAPVLAIFWGLGADRSRYLDGIEATECDAVTTGLKETIRHVVGYATEARTQFAAE